MKIDMKAAVELIRKLSSSHKPKSKQRKTKITGAAKEMLPHIKTLPQKTIEKFVRKIALTEPWIEIHSTSIAVAYGSEGPMFFRCIFCGLATEAHLNGHSIPESEIRHKKDCPQRMALEIIGLVRRTRNTHTRV